MAPLVGEVLSLLVWLGVLVVLVSGSLYLLGKLRRKSRPEQSAVSDLMTKFRELHSRGELSEAEYRTIKTTLTAQLQEELNNNAEKG